MFWKKTIRKLFFKGGKTIFSENDGVQEEICRGAGRSCLLILDNHLWWARPIENMSSVQLEQ